MPYSKLLKEIIKNSGYTSKQIIDECNKRGKKIDKAYLSKLINNKIPAPSEEVSRIIANVCNADERLLVLEGYIDKAPKEVKEAFLSIKSMTAFASLKLFSNKFDESLLKELEKQINEEPLSNFIISLIDNKANNINMLENKMELSITDKENCTLSLTEPLSLEIKDNSMEPIIPQNSKISLKIENAYKNGDILAIKIKRKEGFIVRYCLFDNNTITLTNLKPKEYKTLTYDLEDVIILGKVERVIIDIN